MPCDEQLALLIVRLELFTVEKTTITKKEWNLSIHHKSRHQLHKVHASCSECLCLQPGNVGTTTNFRCLNTPKNPSLNQGAQKKTCQIFRPKKIPELKISNPKISFYHPCHLKYGDPSPRLPLLLGVDLVDIYLLPKIKLFAALLSENT